MAEVAETVLAIGVITGPEARGDVAITRNGDGAITVRLTDVWIAPGAPDVRVYLTSDAEGDVTSGTTVELGKVTALTGDVVFVLAIDIALSDMRSLVVYCSVYSVTFGVAPLEHLAI